MVTPWRECHVRTDCPCSCRSWTHCFPLWRAIIRTTIYWLPIWELLPRTALGTLDFDCILGCVMLCEMRAVQASSSSDFFFSHLHNWHEVLYYFDVGITNLQRIPRKRRRTFVIASIYCCCESQVPDWTNMPTHMRKPLDDVFSSSRVSYLF